MEEEVWKPIPDYEGLYEASSEGRIRSVDREVRHWQGGVHILKGKVRKPAITRDGYLQIMLSKEGKMKWFKVHRLVWMAFNGTIPDDMQVNHIDECKTNNKLENLNLMTPKQNVNWGTRNERNAKALINHPSKSKPVVAFDKNGKVAFEFPSTREAARNGFNSGHISNCCSGRYETHRGYRWKYKEEI